ncbi:MAG: hypothetical protein ACXWPI_16295 [Ktedonobacterales bacterium]
MDDFDFGDGLEPRFTVDSVIVRVEDAYYPDFPEHRNEHWPVLLTLENGEQVGLNVNVTHAMVGLVDDAHLIGARFAAKPDPYFPPHATIPELPKPMSEFVIGGRRFYGVAERNSIGVIYVRVV